MFAADAALDPQLPVVDLAWIENRIEHWIGFGQVAAEQVLDRRRRRVGFRPGAVFAFVRWRANEVGAVASRIDILQAVAPGQACSTVPGVAPGGQSLLRIASGPRVRRALAAVDAIESLGLDPTEAAPDPWRQVQNRLMGRLTARPYTLRRHRAWRPQRALDP